MVGFVHFSNFLIPSEKYYKLQSCWITLYFNTFTNICYFTVNNPQVAAVLTDGDTADSDAFIAQVDSIYKHPSQQFLAMTIFQ